MLGYAWWCDGHHCDGITGDGDAAAAVAAHDDHNDNDDDDDDEYFEYLAYVFSVFAFEPINICVCFWALHETPRNASNVMLEEMSGIKDLIRKLEIYHLILVS